MKCVFVEQIQTRTKIKNKIDATRQGLLARAKYINDTNKAGVDTKPFTSYRDKKDYDGPKNNRRRPGAKMHPDKK